MSSSHKPEVCGTDPFTELHADFGDSRSELTPARCLCGYIVNKILPLSASGTSNVGWLLSPNLYTHLLLNLLFLFFPADRKKWLRVIKSLKTIKKYYIEVCTEWFPYFTTDFRKWQIVGQNLVKYKENLPNNSDGAKTVQKSSYGGISVFRNLFINQHLIAAIYI